MVEKQTYEELKQRKALSENGLDHQKRFEEINRSLLKIANAVNITSDLDELFKQIHLALVPVIDTSNFFIALYDRTKDSIVFPYCVDTVDESYPPVIDASKTASLTAAVIRAGCPLMLTKTEIETQRAKSRLKIPTCTPSEIWLGVPLKTRDEIIGVMAVQSYHDPMCYDQTDMDVMVSVADQVAIAIERKRIEDALREREEKYRWLLNNMSDLIAVMDMSLRFTFVSPSIMRMRGYTVEEALAQTFEQIMTPESLQLSAKVFEEELELEASGKADPDRVRIVEVEEYKKDGSIVLMESHLSFMRDEAKKPVGIISVSHDITDRRRVEKVLRESEEKHKGMIANISDVIAIMDVDGTIRYKSPNVEKWFGWKPEDLVGTDGWETVHPEDMERIQKEFLKLIDKDNSAGTVEYRYKCKDGSYKMIELAAVNLTNDPLIRGVLMNYHDITERKLVDEALRKSEKKLQVVFMHTPAGLILMDGQSVVLECNQYLANMFGTKREKYLGAKLLDRITEGPVRQSLVDTISDDSIHHYEGPYVSIFSEKELFISLSSVKIAPDLIIAIIRDITENKRTEALLKESEARYRQLFENAPAGIYEIDLTTGRMLSVNDGMCEYTGYAKDELLSMNALDLLTEESQKIFIERMAGHLAGNPVTANLEFKGRCKSGREFWMSINPKYFYKEGIPVRASVVAHDITELKRSEAEKEELETQNRQLLKAESLGRMASAIAHNFNNQLQVVIGNLEMAMDDKSSDAECFDDALKAARKAADVSGLMLTYLGQKSGKQEPIDLSEVCRRKYTLLQSMAPKDMILNAVFPLPGPVIRANTDQILLVLTNLVTNAWESTEENRRTIELTVNKVSQKEIPTFKRFPADWKPQESVYACLEVADTGCGISCKDIEKIFDPFYTTKFTGRGMGLSVVLGIVKAHNGGITVESETGQGSIFRVFFPVTAEKVPLQLDKQTQSLEIKEGGTLLLIEDEEQVRNMAKKMLTRLGYTVLDAKDGAEAVEVFQQHHDEIRCVLSDLTMPRMDGWETLAALRKLSPDIPVILSSGYDEAQVMAGAGEHPEVPNAFLGKPYQLKGLRETISRILLNKNKCIAQGDVSEKAGSMQKRKEGKP